MVLMQGLGFLQSFQNQSFKRPVVPKWMLEWPTDEVSTNKLVQPFLLALEGCHRVNGKSESNAGVGE